MAVTTIPKALSERLGVDVAESLAYMLKEVRVPKRTTATT